MNAGHEQTHVSSVSPTLVTPPPYKVTNSLNLTGGLTDRPDRVFCNIVPACGRIGLDPDPDSLFAGNAAARTALSDDAGIANGGGRVSGRGSRVAMSCRRFRRRVEPCSVSTTNDRGDECAAVTTPRVNSSCS
jgi:hypothetical protein